MSGVTARGVDKAGIVIAAVLALVALVIIWDGMHLANTGVYGMGPEAAPYVVAAGLLLLALGNLIGGLRGDIPPREDMDPRAVLLILGGLAVMIALIGLGGGFILAETVLFTATSAAFGRREYFKDAAIGFIGGTLIFIAFDKLLTLSLPAGPIERLL